MERITLPGSHYRTDIALAASEGRITVPGGAPHPGTTDVPGGTQGRAGAPTATTAEEQA